MRSRYRSLCAAVTLALPLVMSAATPASAAGANTVVISGSGTISPGLTHVPADQWVTFTGTATVTGTNGVLATYSCSFGGNVFDATVVAGLGYVSGSCGPIDFTNCQWLHQFGHASIVCVDTRVTLAQLECVFSPTNVLPATQYSVLCAGTWTRVP